MMEILILYTLIKYDSSMYRISKIIEETFFAYSKPSFGALNPAIKRLEGLGCIISSKSVSGGGRKVSRISITNFGEKYLKSLMCDYKISAPSTFLNDCAILLYCSDILDKEEKKLFFDNIYVQLKTYENHINNSIKNPYINLSDIQKNLVLSSLSYVKSLEELCEKGQ